VISFFQKNIQIKKYPIHRYSYISIFDVRIYVFTSVLHIYKYVYTYLRTNLNVNVRIYVSIYIYEWKKVDKKSNFKSLFTKIKLIYALQKILMRSHNSISKFIQNILFIYYWFIYLLIQIYFYINNFYLFFMMFT
jgi:hypothetical protein